MMHNKLKAFRASAGLTEDEVARLLNIHHTTYHKLEKGALRLRLEHLLALADLYNVKMDDLVFGDPSMETPAKGRWTKVFRIENDKLIENNEVFGAPGRVSAGAFTVVMPDDSMAPRINEGDRLLIDPALPAKPGSVVLVKTTEGKEWVVRRYAPLHKSDPRSPGYLLKPVNDSYPDIVDNAEIEGVLRIRQELIA